MAFSYVGPVGGRKPPDGRRTGGGRVAGARGRAAGYRHSWQPQVRNTDRCNPCRACPVGIEWVTTVSAGLAGLAFPRPAPARLTTKPGIS
jgi:hypothetical protein